MMSEWLIQFLLLLKQLKSLGEPTQLPSEAFAALHVNTYLVHRITNVELHVVPITMTHGTDILSGRSTIAQNPSVSGIFHPEAVIPVTEARLVNPLTSTSLTSRSRAQSSISVDGFCRPVAVSGSTKATLPESCGALLQNIITPRKGND
jgi:hypothetical protein